MNEVNGNNNSGLSALEFTKGVGRMFYLNNPKDTLYQDIEDVPNFYVQSWPYFLMFMILENIVLKLKGKKGIRLNDGITSLSNGLFLEGGRLVWRGAESYLYTWIYANWRLVDLPWDSTLTWILAAIGIDFCYYWMHRACHEIHVLWAQHQVHHTSEDFNMGVGMRQSILQGWCGFFGDNAILWYNRADLMMEPEDCHRNSVIETAKKSTLEILFNTYEDRGHKSLIFYLPLALVIPPAQFVLHHQFSYLYMFWIHTETIKTLGFLEHILNTPSHHRIHHGSNPYCIDVNYGGVLIIWDKVFGTFRPEMKGDRIVYGLIYQQPSFNPIHLQTYYTKYVVKKFQEYDNWVDKLRAVLDRPSWKPGNFMRFRDMEEDPKIHLQVKYDVVLPKWCTAYLLSHYSLVLYGFYQLFLAHMSMPHSTVLILVLYILGSLTIFGMILDASPKAPILELCRCMSMLVIARWVTPSWGIILSPPLQLFYALSGLFWFFFVYKTVEINAVKSSD